jgi:penicillin-binding protein 1C
LAALGWSVYFAIPVNLFNTPFATVLTDRNGQMLAAKVAEDGQWRFPPDSVVPEKFTQALLLFEDQYFFRHFGINPVSLWNAFKTIVRHGSIKRGGSTITMQVVRLSRRKSRTVPEKLVEMMEALRLELHYSKQEILAMYAAYAPFGGNVVGLNAASWRYFDRPPGELSWAEAATLAVLPNSPGLIYPGTNNLKLEKKRNILLLKMYKAGLLDTLSYKLALLEIVPDAPLPLPRLAPHLLQKIIAEGNSGLFLTSTLDIELQQKVSNLVDFHQQRLRANLIHNAAALVVKIETGEVLAYVGNSRANDQDHGHAVDIIQAPRSSGSILKPFLYAAMLDQGYLLPDMLVKDVPTFINGFAPKNFNPSYDGAIPASEALSRSLNVPAVQMLNEFGYEKFHNLLRRLGFTTIGKSADHYGLTLILGGAEVTLWDLAATYSGLARTLNKYFHYPEPKRYNSSEIFDPVCLLPIKIPPVELTQHGLINAGAIWYMFKAMQEVARPGSEVNWEYFGSKQSLAWKTGTSFGFRDAWAVGMNREYLVAVWAGNASGEGRPGLTGTEAAAPLMLDIFDQLPVSGSWFDLPASDMTSMLVCRESGFKAGKWCSTAEDRLVPREGDRSAVCPYHKLIHFDRQGFQVNADCEPVSKIRSEGWFVLPPVMSWYYRQKHSGYKNLPAFRPDCAQLENGMLEMIYPKQDAIIRVPRELDGSRGKTVIEVAHRKSSTRLFWHLDQNYLATTRVIHQLAISPKPGKHQLMVVDENGESVTCNFEVKN